jgi:hypothetical protein
VDTSPPKRNPLLPILVGFLAAAFFDFRFYFLEHHYIALGSLIIGPIAVFVALYFMRSRLAWLGALVVIVILAGAMLLTYRLGYMAFPLTLPVAIIDLFLFVMFVGYVVKKQELYFRYCAANEI